MKLFEKHILIVDDDEVLRALLSRVLEVAGCTVTSCRGVKDALSVFKTKVPDLVFLDLNMQEHDGFKFLTFRRQNKILASVPVIVLTGSTSKADLQRALELGADQYMTKPFESRIVLQKLRYIFHKKTDFSYRFPVESMPVLDAEIRGDLIEQSPGHFKIECLVKFAAEKSIQVLSDEYVKSEQGSSFVCRVDKRWVEIKEGLFRTNVTVVGLNFEEKSKLEKWQRGLS